MSKLKRLNNKGYLLVETVASIALIAVVITIVLRSFTCSLRASKISSEYLTASLLAEEELWNLAVKVKQAGGLDESETSRQVTGTNYTVETVIERLGEIGSEGLVLVGTAVLWDNGRRKENIKTATFMRFKEGAI